MSKNYTQLSLEQRYQIEALLEAGIKQKDIAAIIGVHPSTICRELKRNVGSRGKLAGVYVALNAERKTQERHGKKTKRVKLTRELKVSIAHQLQTEKWSPELISQSEKLHDKPGISHETIYKWIWACKQSNRQEDREYKRLYEHLRHGKRRRKRGNMKDRRGVIMDRRPIEKRPAIVNKRKRPGDIEVDLMMGQNHKGAILVMTDRATLHTRLKKLNSKESIAVTKGIIECLRKNNYTTHTLTFDNDMAFSKHKTIEAATGASTYFARPYTSQDKGTVENRIGVLRRFFPKKTDLALITARQIQQVENKLNNRPVRKFNYQTPNQVLQGKIALIA